MTRWPWYSRECRRDVDRILRGSPLTAYKANGKRLEPDEGSQAYKLEREIERDFKVKHAVVTNSGTAALHAGLAGLGVSGGEVVVSPFSFSASVSAVLHAGARPVFADIDPHTFCVTAETVKAVVTRRTKAIVPVDLFGYFPDWSALLDLEIPVVEDACQAVGASRAGRYSGTQGSAGAYSFNGGKNCPSGEGGCLVTNSDKIAHQARLLVNHGENFAGKLRAVEVGFNYRMHELVACVARHGLKALDERNERRRELARAFYANLRDWCWHFYAASNPEKHVYYVVPFTIHGQSRPRFIRRCAKRGLPVQASYTTPLHHLKAFRKYATRKLPVVDELHERTLCLLTTLTPEKPLSYARWCAKVIREGLE